MSYGVLTRITLIAALEDGVDSKREKKANLLWGGYPYDTPRFGAREGMVDYVFAFDGRAFKKQR